MSVASSRMSFVDVVIVDQAPIVPIDSDEAMHPNGHDDERR